MSNQFHVGQGYFKVGPKFDSRNRYIRKVSIAADKIFNMCQGPTIAINTTSSGQAGWRWQCGPATVVSDTGISPPSGFNTAINAAV